MKAIWAAGPRRCELLTLRAPHVVLNPEQTPAWLTITDAREDDVLESTVYSVTILRVGDRAFRVLMPPERSEAMALLALIDSDPALVRQVEVSP